MDIKIKNLIRFTIFCLLYVPVLASASDCDKEYQGLYYWGAEVNAFSPCNSKKSYWVSGSSWLLSSLREYVVENIDIPYQPIYIKFRGHLLNESLDGFAATYDGLIRISEIKLNKVDIPQSCKEHNNGARVHEGVDYIAVLGQDVLAVSGGTITKIGYAYSDDLNYRYIQIDTTDNYRIHQFYVSPAENINVGTVINKGQIIGVAQSLGPRYPGITEHVHIEIRHNGQLVNPTTLIPSP